LLAALFSWHSSRDAFSNATGLSGLTPAARAAAVESVLVKARSARDYAVIGIKARQILRTHPLLPISISQIGISKSGPRSIVLSQPYFLLSSKVSRRDLLTQIWLVESSVQNDNISQALKHYDIALRSSKRSEELLFPILRNAVADDEVQRHLSPYVKQGAPWILGFLDSALRNGTAPDVIARLIRRAGGLPKDMRYKVYETWMLDRFVALGDPQAAKALFLTLNGAYPSTLTTLDFSWRNREPRFAPLTWSLQRLPEIGAEFSSKASANAFHAYVTSGHSGDAARKVLFLRPGEYLIRYRAQFLKKGDGAQASWQLSCWRSGVLAREWTSPLVVPMSNSSIATANVTVPANCDAQAFELRLLGGDGSDGLELDVADVEIGAIVR
jgi:hypothetical protein